MPHIAYVQYMYVRCASRGHDFTAKLETGMCTITHMHHVNSERVGVYYVDNVFGHRKGDY